MGGTVQHAMDMPETKWESDPTGVRTNDPGPLTKAFTNYSSTGHAGVAQSNFNNGLQNCRISECASIARPFRVSNLRPRTGNQVHSPT